METPTLREQRDGGSAQASTVDRLANDASSRKRFLRMVGGTGAAGALGLLIAACGEEEKKQPAQGGGGDAAKQDKAMKSMFGEGDLGIVNYALTLEYLEAQFYRDVAESGVIKDKDILEVAKQFGEHEQTHVDALEKTAQQLGKKADKPKASFQSVIDGGPKMVLETAATVENVGAAAYLGQAAKIQNPEVLAAALSIHPVEAEHAAVLNQVAKRKFKGAKETLEGSLPNGAFGKPLSMEEVLEQVKPFLQS